MTSFRIGISPNRRAAARFVARVRRVLQRALVEERERTGINQSKIAQSLDVHRSVISRELNGLQDITLGRVAELAWAMGREIDFDLVVPATIAGSNQPVRTAGALDPTVHIHDFLGQTKIPVRTKNLTLPEHAFVREVVS
jgi:plasmid maintenance system antidote protein VapI